MHKINRSALVAYDATEMYHLVNAIEDYPSFLPWCYEAKVLEASDAHKKATLGLSLKGLHKHFTTVNHMRPGERIDITLLDGPFRELQGAWTFQPLGEQGSKVAVDMHFEFSNRLLEFAIGSRFQHMLGGLIDAFRNRAQEVYGLR